MTLYYLKDFQENNNFIHGNGNEFTSTPKKYLLLLNKFYLI